MVNPDSRWPIVKTDCRFQPPGYFDNVLVMDSSYVISGARTVVNMAAHFEELKEVSLKLNKQATASTRGYFTPSEDEEI